MAISARNEQDGRITVIPDEGPSYTYTDGARARAFIETYQVLGAAFPGVAFILADDASILTWPGPNPRPDPVAMRAAYLAAQEQQAQDARTLRTRVLNLAQSAVGVQLDQLTAPQLRSLVALLLYREGALDGTGAVRPLADWARS